MGPIISNVFGGVAGNEVQRHVNKTIHPDEDQNGKIHNKLCEIHDDIHYIAQHYRELAEPPIDIVLSLQPYPSRLKIKTHDKKYNSIFVGNASITPQISAEIPGVGIITFTPTTGWNELDFADGTDMYLMVGTSAINVLFRCSNGPLGANVI